jgi:ectoine hydroxylase-related dioxygenase (phytanoyl-CoA dioxygenase family)
VHTHTHAATHAQPWEPPQDGSSGAEGVPIELAAGGAVAFHSSLWHASGPNASASPRRVFYAQYSSAPIVCGPEGQRSPLAFAVPMHG